MGGNASCWQLGQAVRAHRSECTTAASNRTSPERRARVFSAEYCALDTEHHCAPERTRMQGCLGMALGEVRKLEIPAEEAYGA